MRNIILGFVAATILFATGGCNAPASVPTLPKVELPPTITLPVKPTTLEEHLQVHILAAAGGNVEALLAAADIYRDTTFSQHDLHRGGELIVQAALLGNVKAMVRAGGIYSEGDGIEKNIEQAIHWYGEAAAQGDSGATFALGLKYLDTANVDRDEEIALKWLRKAAEIGSSDSQYILGNYYDGWTFGAKAEGFHIWKESDAVAKDPTEAAAWYRKGAQQNNFNAQEALARCYATGSGVEKDAQEAVKWYRKAAEQGSTSSQLSLGYCYSNGTGVPKNESEAIKWFQQAAERGDDDAQAALGNLLINGKGVATDLVEGYKWLSLAASADKGNYDAIIYDFTRAGQRDAAEKKMTQEQVAEAQRRSAAFKPKTWEEIQAVSTSSDSGNPRSVSSFQTAMKGTATAFFISSDGYAVTAAHVVKNSARVELARNGKTYPAKVIDADTANDLAVLKADGDFNYMVMGSSAGVALGAEVCTVGFPNAALQGSSPKATRGNVNSLRGVQDDPRYFQVSAQINPGSSGGALIDTTGAVVGVVVSLLDEGLSLSVSGALPQNVNYAVKSAYLLPLLESVPDLAASLNKTEATPAATVEEAISALESATYLVLVY